MTREQNSDEVALHLQDLTELRQALEQKEQEILQLKAVYLTAYDAVQACLDEAIEKWTSCGDEERVAMNERFAQAEKSYAQAHAALKAKLQEGARNG